TIVRLLLLTGQRRGEIAALRAEYVNGDIITLPATLCKNGREHRFPTSAQSSAILAPLCNSTGLLFPARHSTSKSHPFNGWSKSKAALDKKSCGKDRYRPDLRRTFATKLAALGTPIHITEKLLNHASGTHSG